MNAIDWLCDNAPGFRELSADERNAIMEFSLLWSLFEAKSLNTHGNAATILAAARHWAERGLLTAQTFEPALSYFRDRYYGDAEFTYHFEHLHFRRADRQELVESVLKGEDRNLAEIAAALLIIVYRYRNNLFHGVKWAYEIRGQYENFTYANTVLMQAIKLHDRSQD